ncbi:MAG: hypothetical protein AAGH19_03570 [Pseudomonadota bacterium]
MAKDPIRLLKKHRQLTHSEDMKVTSHVQREDGEWTLNTLMLEGYDVPFQYRRQKRYRSLAGARVNLTYYSEEKSVAGLELEVMKVVRVRRA